ncbi:MAG TPA: TonB-dependent receptor [Bryobacteraceae bacterium]|nr:TonB-dependent receptor [Bryobacteraceae bacterium]
MKKIVCAVSAMVLVLSSAAWGQGGGTLTGTVTDPSGSPVPNATVSIVNEATHTGPNSTTTSGGVYTVSNLPPGVYDVTVSAPGFKEFKQTGITVTVATTNTLNVGLQIGSTSETVEVKSDVAQVESETSEIGTSVHPKLIADLPLQVSGQVRNPIQFVELTPGFTGSLPNTPTSQLSFKINGGQEGGVDVLVDGASISLTHPNLQMNYGVGTDAVAEFRVLSATFPAQYGRATGGVVDLVTKSGTNELHGTAYEILRNAVLDANGWWNNYRSVKRQPDNQNDFGFEVAGPLWIPKLYNGKNRTFFMFNYEGYRYKLGSSGPLTVPDASWNQGNFSNLLAPTTSLGVTYPAHQLYDYTTCIPGPCAPFSGNIIPMSRIDPVVQKAMAFFPKAQNSNVYNNFVNTSVNEYRANLWTAKIDEYVTQKQKISGSWDYENMPLIQAQSLGSIWTSENPSQHTAYGRLNYAYTLTPTLLNEFNFGFSRTYRTEVNMLPTLGKNYAAQIGLKGVTAAQLPSFLPSGVTADPDSADSDFIDNDYQFDENVGWIKGRHSFKFGIDHRRLQFNTSQLAYTSGRFLFGSAQTSNSSDPHADANSGFSYASLFLGAAGTAWIPTPLDIGMRTRYWAAYVQDDFKVSSKLTLNIGFRYEVPTPVSEAHDRQSWMDPTVPNPGAGGLPGAYVFAGSGAGRTGLDSPQSTYYHSFAPRVGLAYALTPNTILRSAYGIYYSPIIVNGFAQTDSAGFSNPFRISATTGSTQPVIVPGQMTGYPGALPPFINPTLANGATGGQPSVILATTDEPGRIQNWTFDIQHQFGKDFLLDTAYVGAHGDHLQAEQRAPNQLNPTYLAKGPCLNVLLMKQATSPACAGQAPVAIPYPSFVQDWGNQATVAQALRPFPQYTDFNLDNSSEGNQFGFYTYEALQVKLQKRFSAGLALMASYTWSKTLTNADGAYPPEGGWNNQDQANMQNNYNAGVEKALSAQDTPQAFVLSYTYELPFGNGKPFLNRKGVVNAIVGGWNVGAIQTYQSGTPISINCGGGYISGLFNPSCRVNVVPGESEFLSNQGPFVFGKTKAFNPAAFSQPPSYTLGDAPRITNIRLAASLNEDVSFEKRFVIAEKVNAIFRMEAFNLLNRHRFGVIDNTVTDPSFGQYTSAGGNRTMQASLRFSF